MVIQTFLLNVNRLFFLQWSFVQAIFFSFYNIEKKVMETVVFMVIRTFKKKKVKKSKHVAFEC